MDQRNAIAVAVAALAIGFAAAKFIFISPLPAPATAVTPLPPAAAPANSPALSYLAAAAEIKKGGYILYFRHGQRQKWDSVIAFDVYELATGENGADTSYSAAVCLTAQGKEEAKMIGKLFKLARVPVGSVAASPVCRARQTAELAFGRVDVLSSGLAHTPVTNTGNIMALTIELKRLLETIPVEAGKNAIIAAHGNTLENNRALFTEGAYLFDKTELLETGFYMIKRDADGKLRVVQKFLSLGHFAANAIDITSGKQ